MLVRNLPPTSRLHKVINARNRAAGIKPLAAKIEDADPSVWSQSEWFLVYLLDQMMLLNFAYRQAHSKTKLPLPKFIPRPGAEPRRRSTLNAWFGVHGLGPPQNPIAPTT